LIHRQRSDARVDDGILALWAADDGGQDRERVAEIAVVVSGAVLAADLAVVRIHVDVGAGLNLRDARVVAIDVIAARSADADNLYAEAGLLESLAGRDGAFGGLQGARLAGLESYRVLIVAVIALNPNQLEALLLANQLGHCGDIRGRLETRAILAHVDVD